MTIRTRRILLSLAVMAFITIGFVLLIYAQGYRWDFQNNKLVLAGAIYIEPISPDETEIFVNDKEADNKSAALIKNLLPLRNYKVRVTKDAYQTWEKELEVTAGFVINSENIVLFPEKLKTQIILPDPLAVDFSVSPNQKLITVNSGKSKLSINNYTGETASSTSITFGDKKKTISIGISKNNNSWSQNSKKLIFWRQSSLYGSTKNASINWYVWDSEGGTLRDLTNLYEKKIVIKQASSSPLPAKFIPNKVMWFGNDNNILVLMNGNIFEIDIKNESVRDLKLTDIIEFDSFEDKIIAIKNPDIIMFMESAIQNVSALGQTKFQAQKILFSPKGDKIAYANRNSIGILWLKDTEKQPFKKIGEQEIIYNGSGYISELYWHKYGEHLVFLENQKLNTIELDKRGKMNIASWTEAISAISYTPEEEKLFILESGSIKSVEGKF